MNLWDKDKGYEGNLINFLENILENYYPKREALESAQDWLINEIKEGKGPFPIRHVANCIHSNLRLSPKVNYFSKSDYPELPFDIIASDNEACSSFFANLRDPSFKIGESSILNLLQTGIIKTGSKNKNLKTESIQYFNKLNIKLDKNNSSFKVSKDNLEVCHIADAGKIEDEAIDKKINFKSELEIRIYRLLSPLNVFPFPFHKHYSYFFNGEGSNLILKKNNPGGDRNIQILFAALLKNKFFKAVSDWKKYANLFCSDQQIDDHLLKFKNVEIKILKKSNQSKIEDHKAGVIMPINIITFVGNSFNSITNVPKIIDFDGKKYVTYERSIY